MWSGGVEPNGLWFMEGSKEYTEETWIQDWIKISLRYQDRPWVVGYDLRNEVTPFNPLFFLLFTLNLLLLVICYLLFDVFVYLGSSSQFVT